MYEYTIEILNQIIKDIDAQDPNIQITKEGIKIIIRKYISEIEEEIGDIATHSNFDINDGN